MGERCAVCVFDADGDAALEAEHASNCHKRVFCQTCRRWFARGNGIAAHYRSRRHYFRIASQRGDAGGEGAGGDAEFGDGASPPPSPEIPRR